MVDSTECSAVVSALVLSAADLHISFALIIFNNTRLFRGEEKITQLHYCSFYV